MLSSRVKISCLGEKAHLVFHWCLYNNLSYRTIKQNLSRDILLLLRDKIKCGMSSMGHGTITNYFVVCFISFYRSSSSGGAFWHHMGSDPHYYHPATY